MAANLKICSLDPDAKEKINKFRFRKDKNNAAIVLKIDMASQTVIVDEEYEDIEVDELREELPSSQPRFVALSYVYTHDDGRISYPLCFIFVSPAGCKPEQQMMYSGTKSFLVNELKFSKVFEIRSTEDFQEDWLREKLKF